MVGPRRGREKGSEREIRLDDSALDVASEPSLPTPVPNGRPTARGLGYKRDLHDPRDYKARLLFGARRGLPMESLELVGCLVGVKDQGDTSSCVGQAISTAIDARLRRTGRWDAPRASSLAVYTYARALERAAASDSLLDMGSYPRLAMKGLREWGVATEDRWPFDLTQVNAELPWDVMQQSAAWRVTSWWRIDSTGKERVEDVCQALAAGYPVVFGTEVDAAFMAYDGKGPLQAGDRAHTLGGHMMCLLGYTTENGARVLRGVNSYGLGWGDRGLFWAGEGFVMDPAASDFYVFQLG